MPVVHAIVLGIVQGLSEFLPISSSGHLLVVPWLFHWNDFAGDANLEKTFDVALHIGTLVALLAYFAKDLWNLVVAGFTRRDTHEGKLAWYLLASAIPAGIVGGLFSSTIEEHLGQIPLIAAMLIAFGLVLLWADRATGDRPIEEARLRDVLWMGAGQALALNPGTSRSGVTMTAGRLVGLSRDAAVRIAFLMSVPITAGAVLFKAMDAFGGDGAGIPDGFAAPFAWGIVTSGVVGFLAVWGVLRFVRTRSFTPFVIYRVLAGVAILAVYALR